MILQNPAPLLNVECGYGKSYVGQTVTSIKRRIKEHQQDVQQEDVERSAMTEHIRQDAEHGVNFVDVQK